MSVRATSQGRPGINEVVVVPIGVISRTPLESRIAPKELLREGRTPESSSVLLGGSVATDASVVKQGVRGVTVIETGREPVPQQLAEFIGIPEWCRRVGCSRESGYRAARRDEIPGLFSIGRLKRVNWLVFVNATGQSNISGAARP